MSSPDGAADPAWGLAGAGAPVVVLGLGNVLMGDDALGPTAVRLLEAGWELGEGVSAIDAGTPGLDLTPFLLGRKAVVIVDTVRAAGAPGTVCVYRKDQLLAAPSHPRLTPHDPGVQETLLTLDLAGAAPSEVILVGVIPGRVETGIGLSEAVRDALPAVESTVLEALRELGAAPSRRPAPAEPELWWERPPG